MIITIDGPAGSGKSTAAKNLAELLGYDYFDTGAMYRAVTYYLLKERADIDDEKKVALLLENFSFEIKTKYASKSYFVNGEDVTEKIRSEEVTNFVSEVSQRGFIRKKMVEIQRNFAKGKDAIFEGRDMGSFVFLYADIKFFFKAAAEVRAKRRFLELKKRFREKSFSYENILQEIRKRDRLDESRERSPLRCAEDAIVIDTTKLGIDKVVSKMKRRIDKKLSRRRPYFLSMKPFYSVVLFFTWLVFKIFYRHKVYGFNNVGKGPLIIASNHTSYLDPPVIAISSPEEVYFVAKAPLFKIPVFGSFIKKLNALPVSRGASDVKTIKQITSALKKGKKVLLFPEGERSFDGKLQKLEQGVGYFSYLTKCLIVPAYIDGAHKIWKRGQPFPKPFGRIRVVFGSPIDVGDIASRNKREFMLEVTNRIEAALIGLKKWCEEGFKNEPP